MSDRKLLVIDDKVCVTGGEEQGANPGGINSEDLQRIIGRVERLEQEKAGISIDITAVYAEAKAVGFDPKIIRQVIKLRKMDPHQMEEQEVLLDLYTRALGMG